MAVHRGSEFLTLSASRSLSHRLAHLVQSGAARESSGRTGASRRRTTCPGRHARGAERGPAEPACPASSPVSRSRLVCGARLPGHRRAAGGGRPRAGELRLRRFGRRPNTDTMHANKLAQSRSTTHNNQRTMRSRSRPCYHPPEGMHDGTTRNAAARQNTMYLGHNTPVLHMSLITQ